MKKEVWKSMLDIYLLGFIITAWVMYYVIIIAPIVNITQDLQGKGFEGWSLIASFVVFLYTILHTYFIFELYHLWATYKTQYFYQLLFIKIDHTNKKELT